MIKNIIFDCGRVIMQYDEKYISSFFTDSEEDAAILAAVAMHRKYWNAFDEGTLKAEDLTIRKLTYKHPTMKALFDQARADNVAEEQ